MTTFTIVTPSYNQAQHIGETMESVLSQQGDFAIEYFVIDGGSRDGSVEIIREHAGQVASGDWPTRCAEVSMAWVSEPDRGQSDAINKGLRRGTGDIVSYVNSDDLYCQGAFQIVADEFSTHPEVDFVHGDGDVIDESGRLQWEWLSRRYNYSVLTTYHFLWNAITNYILQPATFWRRAVLDRIGYLDESFHYAMDLEYWVRAGQAGLNFRHIPSKLAKLRDMPGTKSQSSPTVFWQDQLEIYRRHRGSSALAIYFAYYYYNLGLEYEFDLEQISLKAQPTFERWKGLPSNEQQIIAQQADRGFSLACLLLASELHRRGFPQQAATIFRSALANRRNLAFHPLALPYLLRGVAGRRLSSGLERLIQRLILAYRLLRYDYRYLRRESVPEESQGLRKRVRFR
ncbi:MAG: glycosyltransferase [Anaerolineae bacterium]|nr:glycosyltransferase [Anaerolineae bacterium]NIN93444.1 glycosyltransferase [Anaerolineae bacterium]NIQ76544.1 glycosyltransferase [Anaerolineae bacterium]